VGNANEERVEMSGGERRTRRIWAIAVMLSCLAMVSVAGSASAAPKGPLAGSLDRSFGKAGKAMIAFPAETAGNVGIKYDLPFQFTAEHLEMALAPGGKIVVAGSTRIVRLLADGKRDRSFGSGGVVAIPRPPGMAFVLADVAVDSQGRVLVAGSARPLPASSTPDPLLSLAAVMRFAPDGSLDPDFGAGGTVTSDFGIEPPEIGASRYGGAAVGLRSLVVDAQDRPVLTGGSVAKVIYCSRETAISTGFVARLTVSGGLDPSFGAGGLRQVSDFASFEQAALFPDGDLFAVALGIRSCGAEGGGAPVVLTSFRPEGNLDPGFGFAGFRVIGYPEAPVATVAPSGKIVLLGAKENGEQLVTRLLPNGASDPSFGRTGRIRLILRRGEALAAVTVDKRGRVLVAGRATRRISRKKNNPLVRSTFLLGRMNADSTIDRSFGRKGSVRTGFGGPSSSFATQVQLRGRILVGGGVSTRLLRTGGGFAIARYFNGP
jgi:uncharacterized delta-60 repeat protein